MHSLKDLKNAQFLMVGQLNLLYWDSYLSDVRDNQDKQGNSAQNTSTVEGGKPVMYTLCQQFSP